MKKKFPYSIVLLFTLALAQTAYQQEKEKKCLDCHQKLNAKTFLHEPSGESCKNCHITNGNPHPSEDEEGFKMADKMPQLCYNCHDPLNTKKSVHPPVKKGNCTGCHEVHSSNEKKLLLGTGADLCFFCHGDISSNMDTLPVIHTPAKTGTGCMNCHSPHQSANAKLLLARQKDQCLSCHNKPITKEARTITNIRSELDRNKFIHAPLLDQGCTVCHDPHYGKESNLLKAKFSNQFYVSAKTKENVALCFDCHDSQLLEKDKTGSATGFRNGEQNLHFKHVNKRKGRNCVACHGIHSAPNEFLLLSHVKYGNWNMPLKFTKTETGGKCITACHRPKTYSRVSSK